MADGRAKSVGGNGSRGSSRRVTSLSAHGEPMVWLLGAGMVVGVLMIVAMVGMIATRGLATFWPRAIERVELRDGSAFYGMLVEEQDGASGEGGDAGGAGGVARRLYRVGNRDLGQDPFRWVESSEVAGRSTPGEVVLLEREAWSIFVGVPEAIVSRRVEVGADGSEVVREDVLASGTAETLSALPGVHARVRAAREEARRITRGVLGPINREIEGTRLEVRRAELSAMRAREASLPTWAWVLVVVGAAGAGVGWWSLGRGVSVGPRGLSAGRSAARAACVMAAGLLGIAGWVERPWAHGPGEDVSVVAARAEERARELQEWYQVELDRVRALEADAESVRLVVRDAAGRLAPEAQTKPEIPMKLSDVVRVVRANELGWLERVGVYGSRWGEYVGSWPRDANNEGGVLPVIFGTVMMTMLLSIVVVPLGVIAALYLREYARQGPLVSVIRIAVNNLAGVPSIVYGVFGFGFLCLTVGRWVDGGPREASAPMPWWLGAATLGLVVVGASCLAGMARSQPGRRKWLGVGVGACWLVAVGLVGWLLARTPYFHGFFEEKLPSPTFGGGGVLWASLTLALLTLPVVIVATEEAIAAVPRSVREGSYGCGASKWQTVSRIVLPQAMPGIMTGAILAMARGAGEVAPLMLVGAVKVAEDLVVSGSWPFVHPERSFMHLGFYIYDLGFQSKDADAARPMVWTTTLLLITIVLALNLAAILLRARLRARMVSASI